MASIQSFSIVANEPGSDGVVVLELQGECDMARIPEFTEAIDAVEGHRVMLDLSGLTFLDSTCVGALLKSKARMVDLGGSLRISGAAANVLKVLEITGVYDELRGA